MSDRVTINTKEEEKEKVIIFKSPKLNVINNRSEFHVSRIELVENNRLVSTRSQLN